MNLHTGDTAPSDIDPRALHVHHVREMDGHAAITGTTVGSKRLRMGLVENPAGEHH
jgi:hypothetical protein